MPVAFMTLTIIYRMRKTGEVVERSGKRLSKVVERLELGERKRAQHRLQLLLLLGLGIYRALLLDQLTILAAVQPQPPQQQRLHNKMLNKMLAYISAKVKSGIFV